MTKKSKVSKQPPKRTLSFDQQLPKRTPSFDHDDIDFLREMGEITEETKIKLNKLNTAQQDKLISTQNRAKIMPKSYENRDTIATKPKESGQTEKQVVASCHRWLKKEGWVVKTMFTGGIPIGGGRMATNPAKGIPDCLIFNLSLKELIWVEFKRTKGGKVSPEQEMWHKMLRNCGQAVIIVNSLKSLKEQLK